MKVVANIVGARIAGRPVYTPAHILPGTDKVRSAKCEFSVFHNRRDKKIPLKITAWGGMADAIARGGAVGKEVTITAEVIPYEGKVWMPMPDGSTQFVIKPDGTPLTNWKTGYTIMEMQFHGDSAKCKANEIAEGKRPANWDRPGTPDHQAWLQIIANRKASQYVPNSPTFEYADVSTKNLPQGAMLAPPKVAQNAVQNQPIQQPQQNVMVNGQNMGYAMPQQNQAPVQNAPVQPQQYVQNPGAVQGTMPTYQGTMPTYQGPAGNTGYAQAPNQAVQPGGYSPIVM